MIQIFRENPYSSNSVKCSRSGHSISTCPEKCLVNHFYSPIALEAIVEKNETLLDTEVPINNHIKNQNLTMGVVTLNHQAELVEPKQNPRPPNFRKSNYNNNNSYSNNSMSQSPNCIGNGNRSRRPFSGNRL